MAGESIECEGIVRASAHGIASIDVTLGGHVRTITAKRCGRMNRARIVVVPGDRVRVELSPYDMTRGRIRYRL